MMLQPRLLRLAGEVRGRIAAVALLGLAAAGAAVLQGLLTARAVAPLFQGAALREILPLLAAAAALIAVRSALLWLREVAALWTAAAVKERLRRRLFAHLLELGPAYLEGTRAGRVQTVLVDAVEALEGYYGHYLPQALVTLAASGLVLGYLFTVDVWVAGLLAAAVALVPVFPRLWDRLLGERGGRHWEAHGRLAARFLDSLQGMVTLQAFGAEGRQREKLRREADALCRAGRAETAVSLLGSGVVALATGAGTAVAVAVGAVRLAAGEIDLPALLTLLFLAHECFRPLADLDRAYLLGIGGATAAPLLFELLEARPEVADPAPGPAAPAPSAPPAIAFEGVAFAYAGGERPALADLSFTVPAGRTVGLVGPSGSGKSTAVALLLRLFDPRSGRITLDGRDLREMRLADLRRSIAVVAQDVFLFHGSIADNLRLARPGATQEEIEAAARAAHLHELVAALPQGYDTPVGERGLALSGGERQRLAIARALLQDAPVLVLDEATSSLDGANESAIQQALERLAAGRTTLVVAHRLSAVRDAHDIVVLQAGSAVEAGRPGDLLARRGSYARLVAAQEGAA